MIHRIYLAGPMESVGGNMNFPLFDQIAKELRLRGAEVFSPADCAREMIGPDDVLFALDKKDLRLWRRKLLAREMDWICTTANAMLMLPGWESSPGARAERATAIACIDVEIAEAPDVVLTWDLVDLFPKLR